MESSESDRGVNDGDATMLDSTVKERPSGDPPDGSTSWAKMVMGSGTGGRMTPEMVLDDGFVKERLRVEFPNGEDGEPIITIEEEVLEVMNGLWKKCMIVKMLGRNIPIAVLSKKLRELWKPQGAMSVIDLPRQFFMVRFEEEEEYLAALTGGPWRAFGSHLMVKAWSPDFDPMRDAIVTTPVWVRIANIPVNFYHKSILMGIARGLGKPLKVDVTTLNLERARFARVCVEIDLRKTLKGSLMINKGRYYVSYERLTIICSGCGLYGHLVRQCPQGIAAQQVAQSLDKERMEVREREQEQSNDGFTPARKTNRKAKEVANQVARPVRGEAIISSVNSGKNRISSPIIQETEHISLSNSFGQLTEEVMEEEIREVMEEEIREVDKNLGANKENVNGNILPNHGKNIGSKQGESMKPINQARREEQNIFQAKRAASVKQNVLNGPRNRVKQNKPMRGLVFGPLQEDVEFSGSGKRMRVEARNTNYKSGVVGQVRPSFDGHSISKNEHVGKENRRECSSQGVDAVQKLGTKPAGTIPSEGEMELNLV